MINYKETIKNFRKALPDADLDTLLDLMDKIVETPTINWTPSPLTNPLVPCSQGEITYDTKTTNINEI